MAGAVCTPAKGTLNLEQLCTLQIFIFYCTGQMVARAHCGIAVMAKLPNTNQKNSLIH